MRQMSRSEDGESRVDRELGERAASERGREKKREMSLCAGWILPAGFELLTWYSFIPISQIPGQFQD